MVTNFGSWKLIEKLDSCIVYSSDYLLRLAFGICRSYLSCFYIVYVWICSKLFHYPQWMTVVRVSTCWQGWRKFNFLNNSVQEILLTPAIIPMIFFFTSNTFLLSNEFPKKIAQYDMQWKRIHAYYKHKIRHIFTSTIMKRLSLLLYFEWKDHVSACICSTLIINGQIFMVSALIIPT
jgi:hypothetical protein